MSDGVRRVTITGDCEDWLLVDNDDGDGEYALLPWPEHQAMVDVVEAAREIRNSFGFAAGCYVITGKALVVQLDEALDVLRRVREEE